MTARQLLVMPVRPSASRALSWALHDGNIVYPGYATEDDALLDAIDAAQNAADAGVKVEIVVERRADHAAPAQHRI
jgi:hypothetical protein